GIEPLAEKPEAPVDLAELLLAVDVLRIFTTVALCCGGGDLFGDLGPFDRPQTLVLGLQSTKALARDVLGSLGPRGLLEILFVLAVLLAVRLAGEGFVHDDFLAQTALRGLRAEPSLQLQPMRCGPIAKSSNQTCCCGESVS